MKSFLLFLLTSFSYLLSGQNTTKAWQHDLLPLDDDTAAQNTYISIDALDANLMILGGTYDEDLIISCADSNGVIYWSKTFGGTALAPDQLGSIEVMGGLIYVTGYLDNETTHEDLFIKCFTAGGTELFSYVRDGGIGADDKGSSIAVNNYGQVFVGGYLTTLPSVKTAYLVCLNSSAQVQWEVLNPGTAVGNSFYNSLLIYNGALYTAGLVANTITNNDGLIESRNFSGGLNWDYLYDNNNTNAGYDLLKENNGDLYACGSSGGMIVTRIGTTGVADWTTLVGLDYAFNMAFQSDGDIIVSGADNISANTEIRVVCLRDTGSTNWVYTYVPTPYNATDQPSVLAVAPNDEIYVSGYQSMALGNPDQLLLKLSPSGSLSWTRRRNGIFTGFASETGFGIRIYAGRIVTVGRLHNAGTGIDGTISAYTFSGTSLFLHQSSGGSGYTRDVQIRNTPANTIVAACSANINSIILEEYTLGGVTLQRDTIPCPGTGMPWLKAMTVDASGNIYIGAQFTGSSGNYDIWIAKLTPSFDTLWTAVYASPVAASDVINDIAVDNSGNVYIAAAGRVSSTIDALVLKYSSTGVLLVVSAFNGSANTSDDTRDLLVTTSGDVYLLAYFRNSTTGPDAMLIRLNSNCDSVWSRIITGNNPAGSEFGCSLHEYSDGDIAVTGQFYVTASDADRFVRRYRPDGSLEWTYTLFDPQLNGYDLIQASTLHNDTVYLTGSGVIAGEVDFLTAAVDENGSLIWWRNYNGATSNNDEAHAIAFDSFSRSIWVTGEAEQTVAQTDVTTIQYSIAGVPLDTIIERDRHTGEGGVALLSFTTDGGLYLGADRNNEMARVIKYCVGGVPNTISTSLQMCAGDSVQLNAPPGYSYQWFPANWISDDTIQTPLVNPPVSTSYTLSISTNSGCSAAHIYNVTVPPSSPLQLSFTSVNICENDSVQFNATGFSVYQWSPGIYLSDSTLADPFAYGIDTVVYTLTGTDIFGCPGDSGSVQLYVDPLPLVTLVLSLPDTICNTPGSLFLSGEFPVGGQYAGAGVIGANLHPDLADTGYTVISYTYVNPSTGCMNTAYDSVYVVICTDVANSPANAISVFPVPASDYIVVHSANAPFTRAEIFTTQGSCVLVSEVAPTYDLQVDLTDLPGGLYYARIISGATQSTLKFTLIR